MKELKKLMVDHDEGIKDLARVMGFSYGKMASRLSGTTKFTLEDVKVLAKHYKLTAEDIKRIFL